MIVKTIKAKRFKNRKSSLRDDNFLEFEDLEQVDEEEQLARDEKNADKRQNAIDKFVEEMDDLTDQIDNWWKDMKNAD